ncbi:MAG: hypothetical protein FJ096_23240, partial [Deltaproteobacteria bacterium]|nr:hypothetical protein [Deltaproteobacteria bacterium]
MNALSPARLAEAGLATDAAEQLASELAQAHATFGSDPLSCWHHVASSLLAPELPFEVHRLVHAVVFDGWDAALGPAPVWVPGHEELEHSNLAGLVRAL